MNKYLKKTGRPITLLFALTLFVACDESEPENQITDYDGNIYTSVIIGDQEWMVENIKVTHYRNGDTIQYVQSESSEPNVWENLNTGAYCYYNDEQAHQNTYGNLYNWYAVDDSRKVAPDGWHVPTDTEWKELEMALGMSQSQANESGYRGTNEGRKLAGNAELWEEYAVENDSVFGTSGFTALPSGSRYYHSGDYFYMGGRTYFWSSSEYDSSIAWFRLLYYYPSVVTRNDANKRNGFAIRCVRD